MCMTISKTVLYGLCEHFSGYAFVGECIMHALA